MAKGRSDRIAVIHAVYGLAWAGLSYAVRPGMAAALLIGCGIVVAGVSVMRLRQAPSAPLLDEGAVGPAIVRINVVTGIAVVAAILILHGLHADRYLVPVVLAIMAVHFMPLWRLLGRGSLAVMGAALIVAAAIAASPLPAGIAPALAAFTFLINSIRLSIRRSA